MPRRRRIVYQPHSRIAQQPFRGLDLFRFRAHQIPAIGISRGPYLMLAQLRHEYGKVRDPVGGRSVIAGARRGLDNGLSFRAPHGIVTELRRLRRCLA